MSSSSSPLRSSSTARLAQGHVSPNQANTASDSMDLDRVNLTGADLTFASSQLHPHPSFPFGPASFSGFPRGPPLRSDNSNNTSSLIGLVNAHSSTQPPVHSTTTPSESHTPAGASLYCARDLSQHSLPQHHPQSSAQLPDLNHRALEARGWNADPSQDNHLIPNSDDSFWDSSGFFDSLSSPVQPRSSLPRPAPASSRNTPTGYHPFQAPAVLQVSRPSNSAVAPYPTTAPRHHAPQPPSPWSPARIRQQPNASLSTSLLQEPNLQHAVASVDGLFNTALTDYLSSDPFLASPDTTSQSAIVDIDSMPSSSRKRNAATAQAAPRSDSPSSPVAKRRRTSVIQSHQVSSTRSRAIVDDIDVDDLFGEPLDESFQTAHTHAEDVTTIDLTEANEVPEELKKQVEDKRTKISKFQCVICMDDVKTLTVTHCGHLFCAHCLHQALHADPTRNKCPMCRSKIESKPRSEYTSRTKGMWPLELKLMTATRKGKRKINGKT
jgi:hypothetical protein